jgi:hypothetical protein
MNRPVVKENVSIGEIEQYFRANNYDLSNIELKAGNLALYAEGYQDADFFEIEEQDGLFTLYVC